jgi:hypothetical protein
MSGYVKVFGDSDDLIEIEGDLREEFNDYKTGEEPGYLAFSNGTVIRIQYGATTEAIWRITVIHRPEGTNHTLTPCPLGQDDVISDVLEIAAPERIVCCVYGKELAVRGR